jgi:heme-binding NEAT domain protein
VNDGSHTVYVKAIDKIGNSKEYTTSFSVNVPQPTPSPSPSPTASPSPSPIPSPSPSPSPTPTSSPSPSPTQSPKPIIQPETLWLILAFVLAAAAATTIGLLIGKRKKNEKH